MRCLHTRETRVSLLPPQARLSHLSHHPKTTRASKEKKTVETGGRFIFLQGTAQQWSPRRVSYKTTMHRARRGKARGVSSPRETVPLRYTALSHTRQGNRLQDRLKKRQQE